MTDTEIVDRIMEELNKYQDHPLDPVRDRGYLVVNIGGRLAQGKLGFELLSEVNHIAIDGTESMKLKSIGNRINHYIAWAKVFWSK